MLATIKPEAKSFNRYEFSAKDVTKILDLLADAHTVQERAKIFDLDPSRAKAVALRVRST